MLVLLLWHAVCSGTQVNTRLPKDPPPDPMLAEEAERRPPTQPGLDSPGSATSTGVDQETASSVNAGAGEPRGPRVLLDLWHAENRVGDSGCKTHGAHRPFMSRLRDTFAIPDPAKLEEVQQLWKVRHPTWSQREIDRDMKMNYNRVLQFVPRTVPQPPVIVQRFDLLCSAFEDVKDAKTGGNPIASVVNGTFHSSIGVYLVLFQSTRL